MKSWDGYDKNRDLSDVVAMAGGKLQDINTQAAHGEAVVNEAMASLLDPHNHPFKPKVSAHSL